MTEIKYKGEVIATLESNQKAVLHLKDKKLTGDIDIVAPAPVEDWDGSVVIEGGVELIDFTIDGVSYQAVDGMTWAEWCDSEYNTADAIINGAEVAKANAIEYRMAIGFVFVSTTDTIIIDGEYVWSNEPV